MLPKGAGGARVRVHHDPGQITSLPRPQPPSGERQAIGPALAPRIAEMRSSVDALWTETIKTVRLFKTVLMLSLVWELGRLGPVGYRRLKRAHSVSHQEGRRKEGVNDPMCPESVAIY